MPSVPEYQHTLMHIALQDLRAAEVLVGDAGCEDETVGFHCQQAVEKAFKAVLERRRIEYPLTHDLVLLLALVLAGGEPCPVSTNDARRLNPYAVKFRYERALPELLPATRSDRAGALHTARVAVDWAKAIVEGG